MSDASAVRMRGIREYLRPKDALACLFRYAAIPFLMLVPKGWLVRDLARSVEDKLFPMGEGRVRFYKSGRAAIRGVMEALKRDGRDIALVPDYICNVVPKACEDAGLSLLEYPTNALCMPDWGALDRLISEAGLTENMTVVVCSLFGTEPVLTEGMRILEGRYPELFVVADECQNLVNQSPVQIQRNRVIVFSFNDKTCPGLLGGGVVSAPEFSRALSHAPSPLNRRILLWGFFVGALMKRIAGDVVDMLRLAVGRRNVYSPPTALEYSSCRSAHYDTAPEAIHRISAAYAWLNLGSLNQFESARRQNLEILRMQKVVDVLGDAKYGSKRRVPPFVPSKGEIGLNGEFSVPVKAPYRKSREPARGSKRLYSIKINKPYVQFKCSRTKNNCDEGV